MDSRHGSVSPQPRRQFLRTTGVAAVAGLACGGQRAWAAAGPARGVDASLQSVLATYGSTLRVEHGGVEQVKVDNKICRQPATRVSMLVDDQAAFRRSFERWTGLSDRVLVEGNTVRFSHNSRFYIIENRVD